MDTYEVNLTADLTMQMTVEADNKYHAEQLLKERTTLIIERLNQNRPYYISIRHPHASATLAESEDEMMDTSNWWFAIVNEDAPKGYRVKVMARFVSRDKAKAVVEGWASRTAEWQGDAYFYANTPPGRFLAGRVQSYAKVLRTLRKSLHDLDSLPSTELVFVESNISGAADNLREMIDCLSEPDESEDIS